MSHFRNHVFFSESLYFLSFQILCSLTSEWPNGQICTCGAMGWRWVYIYYLFFIYFNFYILSITLISYWAQWHPKSPVSRLFAQLFVQTQIKGKIKAVCHWPLWGESTSDWWIPLTKDQLHGKCLYWVTSSWTIDFQLKTAKISVKYSEPTYQGYCAI